MLFFVVDFKGETKIWYLIDALTCILKFQAGSQVHLSQTQTGRNFRVK